MCWYRLALSSHIVDLSGESERGDAIEIFAIRTYSILPDGNCIGSVQRKRYTLPIYHT